MPVYQGSTNYDVLGGGPSGGQTNKSTTIDAQHPPAGIPQQVWTGMLQSDYYKNYVLNTPLGKRVMAGTASPSETAQFWDNARTGVQKQWNSLSPQQQKQYTDAEASKNPYDPYTAEGRNWEAEQDRIKQRDLAVGGFQDWQNTQLPALQQAFDAANAGDKDAEAKLQGMLANIKDPEIQQYVGDYISQGAQAGPSQEAMARQLDDYNKLKSLSDPSITAEERLMQEMSRRTQENDLKAQRAATANDLQARGVYGSGAEIAMGMGASQEAAQRRAYEEMQAQANAQERAMGALKEAASMGTQMRGQEASESQFRGSAADRASEFNKAAKEQHNQWATGQQGQNNRDAVARGQTGFNATTQVNNAAANRAGQYANTSLGGVTGEANARLGFNTPIYNAQDTDTALADQRAAQARVDAQ